MQAAGNIIHTKDMGISVNLIIYFGRPKEQEGPAAAVCLVQAHLIEGSEVAAARPATAGGGADPAICGVSLGSAPPQPGVGAPVAAEEGPSRAPRRHLHACSGGLCAAAPGSGLLRPAGAPARRPLQESHETSQEGKNGQRLFR